MQEVLTLVDKSNGCVWGGVAWRGVVCGNGVNEKVMVALVVGELCKMGEWYKMGR